MMKIYTSFLLFLIIVTKSFSYEWKTFDLETLSPSSIAVSTEGRVVVSQNETGRIYLSDDQGITWVKKEVVPFGIQNVLMVNNKEGYACRISNTDNNKIIYTKNGWDTFETFEDNQFSQGLSAMSYYSGELYVTGGFGGQGYFGKSTDNKNWFKKVLNYSPSDIYFFDNQQGIILHQNGIIITKDGGENWDNAIVFSHSNQNISNKFKIQGSDIYLMINDTLDKIIYKSSNKGNTWTKISNIYDNPFSLDWCMYNNKVLFNNYFWGSGRIELFESDSSLKQIVQIETPENFDGALMSPLTQNIIFTGFTNKIYTLINSSTEIDEQFSDNLITYDGKNLLMNLENNTAAELAIYDFQGKLIDSQRLNLGVGVNYLRVEESYPDLFLVSLNINNKYYTKVIIK